MVESKCIKVGLVSVLLLITYGGLSTNFTGLQSFLVIIYLVLSVLKIQPLLLRAVVLGLVKIRFAAFDLVA